MISALMLFLFIRFVYRNYISDERDPNVYR